MTWLRALFGKCRRRTTTDQAPAVRTYIGWTDDGGRLTYTGTDRPHGDEPHDWPIGTVWIEPDETSA